MLVALAALLSLNAPAQAATDRAVPAGQGAVLSVVLDDAVPEHRVDRKFRSPEKIDAALAADLARRMQGTLSIAQSPLKSGATPPGTLRLTTLDSTPAPSSHVAIPVPYTSVPMAIMRTDTTIRRWSDLKGRTVCVSEGGNHVGMLAAHYGAIEQIHPAPADALIALRIGTCDAAVHDSAMLEELIKLPEWKKFSARLAPDRSKARQLALLVPAGDSRLIDFVKQTSRAWQTEAVPVALMQKAVRSIAFEVYLDQDVPDCH